MVFFEEVQHAFQNEEDIKYFDCVAAYHSGPCGARLTNGQKEKLTRLFRKQKSHISLDELRIIIWELLCENIKAGSVITRYKSRMCGRRSLSTLTLGAIERRLENRISLGVRLLLGGDPQT